MFSTPDADNDLLDGECSKYGTGRGGFWFVRCGAFYPNAFYYQVETVSSGHGLEWKRWIGTGYSLKGFEFMIRRKH